MAQAIRFTDFENISDYQMAEFIHSWIKSGRNVDENLGSTDKPFTLLHCACFYVKANSVKLLIQNGANPNTRAVNEHTALSLLASNFFAKEEEKDNKFWSDYRQCLFNLVDAAADFNIECDLKKKSIFLLLKNEKSKIPKDIIHLFLGRTDLKAQGHKSSDSIVPVLLANVMNFNIENMTYLIEEKGIELNNKNDPANSIVFLMSYLGAGAIQQVKSTIEALHKKFGLDFELKLFNQADKKKSVKPIEVAIAQKNLYAFKFIVKNNKEVINANFGGLNLPQYCAMVGFTKGLNILLKEFPYNWEQNDRGDLVVLCSSDNAVKVVNKAYSKDLYNALDSKLKKKEVIDKRKMKI